MTRRARGLFVTATDTGIGKTLVSCELIRRLRSRGIDACGMKPVETGVGAQGPLDALALLAASGGGDALADVCPQGFALPAAPAVAAEAEGRAFDLDAVLAAFERLSARHDCVIAEGAGGLLVPLGAGLEIASIPRALGLPVLLVARARLGTLNHTLLTLEALRARSLRIAGVIVSRGDGPLSDADERNLGFLRSALGALWVGDLPYLGEAAGAPAAVPASAIDLDAILRALAI